MKVLHVINSLESGGAEALLYRLTTLASQDQHLILSLGSSEPYGPLLQQRGIEVLSLQPPPGSGIIKCYRGVWQRLRRFSPVVVQGWMYRGSLVAGFLARVLRVRAVWSIHCAEFRSLPPKSQLLIRVAAWSSWILADVIVSCSRAGETSHVAVGFPQQRMMVIANGVNVKDFSAIQGAAGLRQRLGVAGDTFLIGTVSRWHPQKDVPNLLASLRELKSRQEMRWHCVLAGNGMNSSNSDLTKVISAFGLEPKVTLLGCLDDIPELMTSIDLHVLPSFEEAFPNVLLEAMACETPCVATAVGDVKYIVGDTGWVVPRKQAEKLASAILEAEAEWRNETRTWVKRQQNCRKRVLEEFCILRMYERYREVWSGSFL